MRVAEERVGSFHTFELNGFAESLGEIFGDAADAEDFGTSDVDDERRGGSVKQRLQAHVVGVGLPDGVEIAHGKRDGLANMDALRDVHEDAVAKLGGVVEAKDGGFDICGAAEMFEDAFAPETTDGVFADGDEFIGFQGTAASDWGKTVDVAGGECGDAAVAKTIGDEAGEKRVHGPGERLLARGAEFHSGHINNVWGAGEFGENSGIEKVATDGFDAP